MPDNKPHGLAVDENTLTNNDLILLRNYVNLLNRRKDLARWLRNKRDAVAKIEKGGDSTPDHGVNMELARSVIRDLLKQDSDIATQEQGVIDQMSEEAKREAYAIKNSISACLEHPANNEVM